MPADPLATPPPPPVERLNRAVLLVAALIVMVTLLVVAFVVSPRAVPRSPQPAQPALTAGAPGFLNRPPGTLPPRPRPPLSEQDYLRSLEERAAPAEPQPAAPFAPPGATAGPPFPTAPPPGTAASTSPAPPPEPRDPRREEFLRALRAPLAAPLPPVPIRGQTAFPGLSPRSAPPGRLPEAPWPGPPMAPPYAAGEPGPATSLGQAASPGQAAALGQSPPLAGPAFSGEPPSPDVPRQVPSEAYPGQPASPLPVQGDPAAALTQPARPQLGEPAIATLASPPPHGQAASPPSGISSTPPGAPGGELASSESAGIASFDEPDAPGAGAPSGATTTFFARPGAPSAPPPPAPRTTEPFFPASQPPATARFFAPRRPTAPAALPASAALAAARAIAEPGSLPVVFHPPPPATTLAAGTLIAAQLETEVNSDLAGPVLAQVSRDVYDASQQSVVVPRGSRLLGRYENRVAVGQRRLLVAWTRITFPDGAAFDFPGLPGTDPAGAAGLGARVQNHLLRLFGDALLLSLLSAGADLSQPASRNLTLAPSAGSVASAAAGQELANVGLQLLRRDLAVQPTLRLAAGTPFLVFVNGDLPLARPFSGAPGAPGAPGATGAPARPGRP
jgi:type IV secretory pathway VirB10-like protein